MRSIVTSEGTRQREDLAPLYFLHIPKTGGTSVRQVLTEIYGDRLCPAGMWDDFFRAPELRTNTYEAYSGHFGIDLPIFLRTRMRVFTLLREPVARTLSHYLEVRRTTTHPLHNLVSTQTLRDFVFDPVTVPMVLNFQARYLASTGLALEDFASIFSPYWHSQYTLSVALENASCYMNSTTLKSAAISALQSLAFVGITEDFDEDFRRLQQKFRLPDIPVPRANASPPEDAKQTIAPDVEQRIRDLTSVDAEIYSVAKKLREAAHEPTEEMRMNEAKSPYTETVKKNGIWIWIATHSDGRDQIMSADIESPGNGRLHTLLLSDDRKGAQLLLPLAQKALAKSVGGDNSISRIRLTLFQRVPD